jgi:hypothetical protein
LKGITLTDLGRVKGAIVTFAVAGVDHVALRDTTLDAHRGTRG